MEKCIRVMEKELFLGDTEATEVSPKASDGAMIMALAGLKHVRDVLSGKQVNFDPKVFDIDTPEQRDQASSNQTSGTNDTSAISIPVHPPPPKQSSNANAQHLQPKQPHASQPDGSSRGFSTLPVSARTKKYTGHPNKPCSPVETQEDLLDPLGAKNMDKKISE